MTTPTSPAGQPPTWKTNVNRAKTKRWVEAKSYSYDGDDWGEVDDFDEYPDYGHGSRPAQSQPAGRSHVEPTGGANQAQHGNLYQSPTSMGVSSPTGNQLANAPVQPRTRPHNTDHYDYGQNRQPFPGEGSASAPGPGARGLQSQNQHPYPATSLAGQHGAPPLHPGRSMDHPYTNEESRSLDNSHGDARRAAQGSVQHPPRKSSVGQQQQPPTSHPNPASSPSAQTTRPREGSSTSARSPFVRPADIYKRMEEERERERRSQDSTRPNLEIVTDRSQRTSSPEIKSDKEIGQRLRANVDLVSERKDEQGLPRVDPGPQGIPIVPESEPEKRRTTSKSFDLVGTSKYGSSQSSGLSGKMMLPDPTRMSGFGEGFGASFMGSSNSSLYNQDGKVESAHALDQAAAENDSKAPQDKSDLRHQPSKGYTSAVHQAFDNAQDQVPPTPSSVADSSVARSTSGGTSAVSPIMSRGPSAVNKEQGHELPSIEDVTTPTQENDDERSRALPGTSTQASKPPTKAIESNDASQPAPGFKMGHRRETSPPSPENSPAKTPVLASMSRLKYPQEAELAQTTPTPTDSVPSASNSFRQADRPASPIKIANERSDSPSGGRVKNLSERFEAPSRPDSAQSETTPRQSVIAPASPHASSPESSRPVTKRLETFRPHLPGGWQSEASIAPPTPQSSAESAVQSSRFPPKTQSKDPSQSTSPEKQAPFAEPAANDPSKSAFAAAAQAGNALATAISTAAGVTRPSDQKSLPAKPGSPHPDTLAQDTSKSLINEGKSELREDVTPSPSSARDKASNNTPSGGVVKQTSSLPPISTRESSGEYESDRLRREIVRELDSDLRSDPTTATTESSKGASRYPTNESLKSGPSQKSTGIPSEYDSYWDEDSDGNNGPLSLESTREGYSHPGHQQQPSDAGTITQQAPIAPLTPSTPVQKPESPAPLTRKFSWEQPLAEIPSNKGSEPKVSHIPNPVGIKSQTEDRFSTAHSAATDPEPLHPSVPESAQPKELPGDDHLNFIPELSATPKLTLNTFQEKETHTPSSTAVMPAELDSSRELDTGISSARPDVRPTAQDLRSEAERHQEVQRDPTTNETPTSQIQPPPQPPPVSTSMPKTPAFREILSLKSGQERIHAFTTTQQQFAAYDSGLDHWLASTLNNLPEHSDLVKSSGMFGRPGQGLTSRPTGQGQLNTRSGTPNLGGKIKTQQVQAKGKEFLHSAGVFGGKANVAAKGLFSKGRNKLRDASGSKKV